MVVKKKPAKKAAKAKPVKAAKAAKEEESDEHEGGASLDDAFGDDEDVEYAPVKPRKEKKKKEEDEEEEELEEELDEIQHATSSVERGEIEISSSKPIGKIKKGDKITIDGKAYEVDAHYVMIDHGSTKEMVIEIFDANDKDYQLRYFDDQVERTLDLYELQEILYVKRPFNAIKW